jgi:hypothetical protein
MPSFPLSNSLNLCDGPAVEQYHSHLETARNLAQLKGLKPGLRYTLDLSIPPANPLPNARSLPLLPPQSHHISLRLQRALQSGVDKFSQVWTAVVETPGAQRAKETTLVLKIIQPSMCPYPGVDDNWGLDYMFPEYIALQEAWVYNQLTHKQGLFIPYFFGMHTVRLSYPVWRLHRPSPWIDRDAIGGVSLGFGTGIYPRRHLTDVQ